MIRPFQLIAAHPALDLVNTLDWRFRDSGPEELLSSYDDLLRFTQQSALLTLSQIRQLRRVADERTGERAVAQTLRSCHELREAAAEIFYALVDDLAPSQGAIKKLDHALRSAQSHRVLEWTRAGARFLYAADSDPRLPLWLLAQSAADLLTGDTTVLIRTCADPGCRWLFLDTSKNHSRRWCDMKICGNRMKARRFKAQGREPRGA